MNDCIPPSSRRFTAGLRSLALIAALLLTGTLAQAADRYVRAGATGSGSDWTNALGKLPATLVRGDTYWVADGTYPGYNFGTAASGSTYITVKKATASTHGTGAGWQAAYGDGVATWGPMGCSTSYIIFDGVTGKDKSGHGFEIYSSNKDNTLWQFTNAPKYVTIAHARIHQPAGDTTGGDAIYGNTPCANITVRDCYIHDIGRCPLLMRHWTNLLLERCWIARNHSDAVDHAEGISTHGGGGHIIRYCTWEDIEGTAIIVNLSQPTKNWEVYGNCFFQTGSGSCSGVGHGIIGDNFDDSGINGLKYYNNSAYNITGISSGLRFWGSGAANIQVYNNVWYNCQSVGFNGVNSLNYNSYYNCAFTFEYAGSNPGSSEVKSTSGSPYTNTTGNFRLKAVTAKGMTLAAPWNKDFDNKTRGGDGNWDRGAFEFGGTPSPTPTPTPTPKPTVTPTPTPKPTVTPTPTPKPTVTPIPTPKPTVTPTPTPPPAPAGSLMAAYSFNEGVGTTLVDRSGRGNNGTISGARWTPYGRFGGALEFNGVNNRVTIKDSASLDLTGQITIEAWVIAATSIDNWRTVVMKEGTGKPAYSLYANNGESNKPYGSVTIGGQERAIAGGSKLPLYAWQFLTMTYDGANIRYYVNGVQVSTQAQTGALQPTGGVLTIGGNGIWNDEFFQGRIDQIRIYNKVLTKAQILVDMTKPL